MSAREAERGGEVTTPSREELLRLDDLCRRSLYLQAYDLVQPYLPLQGWRGAPERILAGRLAWHLGAARLCQRLHLRAWREDPQDAGTLAYACTVVLERLGPVAAWEFQQGHTLPESAEQEARVHWLTLRARIAGIFRDFDTADSALAQAEAVAPSHPALLLERAVLYEAQDRYEEAVRSTEEAVALRPEDVSAAQALAHALTLVGRDAEAADLLARTARATESYLVVGQLATIQSELGDHAGARRSLERMADLAPIADVFLARRIAAFRSDAAYECGDIEEAIAFARLSGPGFHESIASRLPNGSNGCRRVRLDVGFVRQHHMTCAPATLTAISRFWGKEADHLEIAEQICYDGTPGYSERAWAGQNGWLAREFTITWDSARALLDRGAPFTIATVAARAGHLQAAIGYDERRGTLLVRDPYMRHAGELLAHEFLDVAKSTGPRGMVLVPRERAALLESVGLPDAGLWDGLDALQRNLLAHSRAAAYESYRAMSAQAPDHFLTHQARRCLAAYDADTPGMLACLERSLELYPRDPNLLLDKLGCLRELARRDERMAMLERICQEPGSDPVFHQFYAAELSEDAREHRTAARILRRVIRHRHHDASGIRALADIDWVQGHFEKALDFYRFAACLNDKDESHAMPYFAASRQTGQVDGALEFLEGRAKRFLSRSCQPLITLFRAYCDLDRRTDAFVALEEGLRERPQDGVLLLFAADAFARHGNFQRAEESLQSAETRSKRADWLRVSARLSAYRGDLATALASWRDVLAAEPLASDANAEVATLLEQTQGRSAALEHTATAVARFPHSLPLQRLRVHWLGNGDPAAAVGALRRLIEINPVDVWARRELALALGQQGLFEEAFAEIGIASLLDPSDPWTWAIAGNLARRAGKMEEAREATRKALQLSADVQNAVSDLVFSCGSAAERREALAFIRGELIRQVSAGDSLFAYREIARGVLEPKEVLDSLREYLQARPDAWRAWSALIRQLTDMGELDEPMRLSETATSRFPLEPQLWLDRALVFQLRSDPSGEAEALGRALQCRPWWGEAVRRLAELHQRSGDLDAARRLLERAVESDPLDAINHGYLAETLWKLGEREEALRCLERALGIDPSYAWAWTVLRAWSNRMGDSDGAARVARKLTGLRPGDATVWLRLARTLETPADLPEALAAIDTASRLDPRGLQSADLRAEILCNAGRFDEALAACRDAVPEEKAPLILRGRAAWVEARRGDVEGAIKTMKRLLEEDSGYRWGWDQLARWSRATGANSDYLASAVKLVQLAPLDPSSHGRLGEARLLNGELEAGKRSLQRAIELAPDYEFAARTLIDLFLNASDLDAAARTIESVRGHIHPVQLRAWEASLSIRRDDKNNAEQCIEDVSRAGADGAFVKSLLDEFASRWPRDADWLLDELVQHPDADPDLGSLWVQRCLGARIRGRAARWLGVLQTRGQIGLTATGTFIEELTKTRRHRRLRRYIRSHESYLGDDTSLWGGVLRALVTLGHMRAAARWGDGWERRERLQPWILNNLVLSLRALGREDEARKASRLALSLPEDHTSIRHALWLAADEASCGATEAAIDRLARIGDAKLERIDSFLARLARATVDMECSSAAERGKAFSRARFLIEEAENRMPTFRRLPGLKRLYRRSVRRIAQARGGLGASLWATRRCLLI